MVGVLGAMGVGGLSFVPGVVWSVERGRRRVCCLESVQKQFPSCPPDGCVEEVRSELHLYSYIRGGMAGEVPGPRRGWQKKPKLIVVAAYSSRVLSFQRVKSEYFNICERHPEVKFLMLDAEKFMVSDGNASIQAPLRPFHETLPLLIFQVFLCSARTSRL